MYLNDVEEGGETAFPMAHEEVFDTEVKRTIYFAFNYQKVVRKLLVVSA